MKNKDKKSIDFTYWKAIINQVKIGSLVPVPVSDDNMAPFLVANRDIAYLMTPPNSLSVGDIVLYRNRCGEYILSRIYKVDKSGCYFIGDGAFIIDGPYPLKSCLAYAPKVERKGRYIGEGLVWTYYANCYIFTAPFRKGLLKFRKKK